MKREKIIGKGEKQNKEKKAFTGGGGGARCDLV